MNAGDNIRFNGFPSPVNTVANPELDPAYSAFDASGVGWYVQDTRRQFALVSPSHFVCATHFRPRNDGQVRFLGTDGVVRTYEILRTEVIVDASGGNTDLSLGTLGFLAEGVEVVEAVDTNVIHPLAYANLASDAAYAGPGFVFGRTVRVGNTTFGGVTTTGGMALTGSEQVDNTRMQLISLYSSTGVDGNDALLEDGDSGSPSFPCPQWRAGALVGTNSAVINTLA